MQPTEDDWRAGQRIYREFSAKPESGHIASAFALAHLSACLRSLRPRTVLELGAGIGTITKLILEHPDAPRRLVMTEDHPVCLAALSANLAGVDRGPATLVRSLDELLGMDLDYDLVICDGGFSDARQFRGVHPGTTCFFEGSRGPHRRALSRYLASAGLTCEIRNYPRPGYVVFLKKPKGTHRLALPTPRVKRRKGCWIGVVARAGPVAAAERLR